MLLSQEIIIVVKESDFVHFLIATNVYASIFIAVHLSVLLNLQGMRDVAKEKEHMPNLEEEVREPLK